MSSSWGFLCRFGQQSDLCQKPSPSGGQVDGEFHSSRVLYWSVLVPTPTVIAELDHLNAGFKLCVNLLIHPYGSTPTEPQVIGPSWRLHSLPAHRTRSKVGGSIGQSHRRTESIRGRVDGRLHRSSPVWSDEGVVLLARTDVEPLRGNHWPCGWMDG